MGSIRSCSGRRTSMSLATHPCSHGWGLPKEVLCLAGIRSGSGRSRVAIIRSDPLQGMEGANQSGRQYSRWKYLRRTLRSAPQASSGAAVFQRRSDACRRSSLLKACSRLEAGVRNANVKPRAQRRRAGRLELFVRRHAADPRRRKVLDWSASQVASELAGTPMRTQP